MDNYKIEVMMTPDYEYCFTPYFWCILKLGNEGWCNCGHGWAKTPEEAWKEAYEWYDDITSI